MRTIILAGLLFYIPSAFAATGSDLYVSERVAKDIKFRVYQTPEGKDYIWARITRDNGSVKIYTCLGMPLNEWLTAARSLNDTTVYDALMVSVPNAPMPWIWTNRVLPPENLPTWCLE